MQRIRITAVSYLNTKPFIYGLFRSELSEWIDLSLDIPSVCAQKLLRGEADLALTPVAIVPELPKAFLVSDYCIGSTGAVKTVCLYAHQPLENIKRIYLDFHSRSSVALTQVLCREYWHIKPEFIPAQEGYIEYLKGDTAGLVIGDRTIGLEARFPYVYDLGAAWTDWTGLPFVFAAWFSTRPLPQPFVEKFNQALASGLDHLPELTKILPAYPNFDLDAYYRDNISYALDEAKWLGLQRFLGILSGEKGYHLESTRFAQVHPDAG
ncbi:MAG: menaquinone biosynthesis protein [Chitinophagales bacterium]|nr:menaquinone biosynthesis protein [Chitinophagales bacterium]